MNGLKKFWKMKVFITSMTMLMISTTSWSVQISSSEEQSNHQEEEQSPGSELLEFLGLFDDEENGWIDPIYLLEESSIFNDSEKAKEGKNERP